MKNGEKKQACLKKRLIDYLFYFLSIMFVFSLSSVKCNALDPKYYSDQYDDADREYFLEEERKEQEKQKRQREERKNRRSGVLTNNFMATETKQEPTIAKTEEINDDKNNNFLQLCNFDIKKFCKLRRKHKNYELKSTGKCQKKLTKNWAYLQPSCQAFLAGAEGAKDINKVNYYVGGGIKISQTMADGKVIKRPNRMKINRQ